MKRLKILSPYNESYSLRNPYDKYKINYGKEKTITATDGTIGIMCFDNLINVKKFLIWDMCQPTQHFELVSPDCYSTHIVGKICEVETFNETEPPKLITFGSEIYLNIYYHNFDKLDFDDLLLNIDPTDNTVKAVISPSEVVFLHKTPEGTICAKKITILKILYNIIYGGLDYGRIKIIH